MAIGRADRVDDGFGLVYYQLVGLAVGLDLSVGGCKLFGAVFQSGRLQTVLAARISPMRAMGGSSTWIGGAYCASSTGISGG